MGSTSRIRMYHHQHRQLNRSWMHPDTRTSCTIVEVTLLDDENVRSWIVVTCTCNVTTLDAVVTAYADVFRSNSTPPEEYPSEDSRNRPRHFTRPCVFTNRYDVAIAREAVSLLTERNTRLTWQAGLYNYVAVQICDKDFSTLPSVTERIVHGDGNTVVVAARAVFDGRCLVVVTGTWVSTSSACFVLTRSVFRSGVWIVVTSEVICTAAQDVCTCREWVDVH